MTNLHKYNLFHPGFKAEAYHVYATMREQDPVCLNVDWDGESPAWFITRYEDAKAVLKDQKRFVVEPWNTLPPDERPEPQLGYLDQLLHSEHPIPKPYPDVRYNHMLQLDGDDHTRLKSLVSKVFTPRFVEQMRGHIQRVANTLLDQVQEQGHMDLISDFSDHFALTIITEMLGVPMDDSRRFSQWSAAAVASGTTAEEREELGRLMHEFVLYIDQLCTERRQHPQDDLLTALIQAEEKGDRLKGTELHRMVFTFMAAGHGTTANMIGNCMLLMFQHPELLTLLKSQPALMPKAVEEFLRYDGSVERAPIRFAAEDVTIGGQTIRRGERVIVVIASANYDPEQFGCPHKFDLNREQNPHLSFGFGTHYCLGAALARVDIEIALNTLLARLPNVRLGVPMSELTWKPSAHHRGLKALPILWD